MVSCLQENAAWGVTKVMDELLRIKGVMDRIEAGGSGSSPSDPSDSPDRLIGRIDTIRERIAFGVRRAEGCGFQRVCGDLPFVTRVAQVAQVVCSYGAVSTEFEPLLRGWMCVVALAMLPVTTLLTVMEDAHGEGVRAWEKADEPASNLRARSEQAQRIGPCGMPSGHGENVFGESA